MPANTPKEQKPLVTPERLAELESKEQVYDSSLEKRIKELEYKVEGFGWEILENKSQEFKSAIDDLSERMENAIISAEDEMHRLADDILSRDSIWEICSEAVDEAVRDLTVRIERNW